MVHTGIFIGVYIQPGSGQKTGVENSVKQMCKGELMDKAKLKFGPKVTSIEKFGVGCILKNASSRSRVGDFRPIRPGEQGV